jgi:hypothetical protein
VIILTLPQSGLMTQASIGGQEFDFTPYEASAKAF